MCKKIDSQNKTHSMIGKITFSASEKGLSEKLMFQSKRCGVCRGFGKRTMHKGSFLQQEKNICIVSFSSHMSHICGHTHLKTQSQTRPLVHHTCANALSQVTIFVDFDTATHSSTQAIGNSENNQKHNCHVYWGRVSRPWTTHSNSRLQTKNLWGDFTLKFSNQVKMSFYYTEVNIGHGYILRQANVVYIYESLIV